MEVWAPVVAGALSGLITALAAYWSGLAVWKRDREAAAETRRFEAQSERAHELGVLRREVVAAFVDGRVALARLWSVSFDSAGVDGVVPGRDEVEKIVEAAQRLTLAGQQLGRQIGSEDAITAANELTAAIMTIIEASDTENMLGLGYSSWASTEGGAETKISKLVDRLVRLS